MNDLQITYFLHLGKTLNITETARQLFVAQPSVSKQLARMERELGFLLFVRTNRGLALTDAGQIMLQFYSEERERFQRYHREAAKRSRQQNRILTVGVLENLGVDELFRVIHLMRAEQPEISINPVRLDNNHLMARLANHELDLAITFDHALMGPGAFQWEDLLLEQSLFIISKEHPKAKNPNLKLRELSGELFCHSWTGEEEADRYLHSLIEMLGITPRGYVTVENLASGLESIEANYTVGLVDERIQIPYPERFRTIGTGTYQSIVIAWDKENTNTLISPFVKHLKEQFPALPLN